MWKLTRKFVFLCLICRNILFLNCQEIDYPRGPWQLAFKVVSGNWNQTATGYTTFWELFTSTSTYNTGSPVPDQRDFSTSSDHYKSDIVEQWEDGYISVQAIKLSLFKNNVEKAYVVLDAIGKTKTTWFKCDNILYSSFSDLPDNTLPAECPGRNVYNGLPLTMMKISYQMAFCAQTTGWLVVADTDFGFSLCPNYMPADGTEPKPYFKYSTLTAIADLSTELETADSLGIFFQVWDMAFKGIEGIKPAASGISNLTGLFMSDLTENDNSDLTVRNLQHSQSSQLFKSNVVNLWDTYYIDMVKFSMLKSGVEHAYVVFDGINTGKTSWFSESNILYSSYGSALNDASLEVCSIEGDTYRNWQIQSIADDTGCSSAEQLGWMLVKEPKNNGTCSWDTASIKKKPYFLYNTGSSATNPSMFQYADVVAVFVHGWRLVLKVAAGGSVSPKSGIYSLWTESGGLNEEISDAATLSSNISFKSSIIDQWTSYYIRGVKISGYKDDMEVFNAVFDATGSSYTSWLDCNRLLYTSVSGLTATAAVDNGYTCSMQGESSTFRFLIGKSTDCGTVSATGVFSIVDADSTCSSRNDLPQFVFSNTLDATLSDMTELQLADTFAIFVDMANCYSDTCLNGATCQDLGGNFRCFCAGSYYGDTCSNLDGIYGQWSSLSDCSVTCAEGTQTRSRACTGTEGDGICVGESSETVACTLDPCPIDGGYTEWNMWSQCTVTCDPGTRTRSRECTNPNPQFGGSDCVDPSSETENCNTNPCPIDGGLTDWSPWSVCSVTCEAGTQSRERLCTNPAPQHGGADCTGELSESIACVLGTCPIDGGYTEWGEWETCSLICGGGQQSRTRECTNPVPQFGGSSCSGNNTDTQTCNTNECPIDGGYTEWGEWGTCSLTCGGGQQSRTRECTNPVPQFGGSQCSGNDTDLQTCNTNECPIDGGYTEWGEWGTCSLICGGGQQSRTRECTNPVPKFGGSPCFGNDTETQTCNTNECPIDGRYTEWGEWGTCSLICGGGQQSRTRECTNPVPQFGGSSCSGNNTDTQTCNTNDCPIDGGYTEWGEWGTCSLTCGGGQQSRTRECTNPVPQFGGSQCSGNDTDLQTCNTNECPIDGGYTEWVEWDTCSLTCGGGQQSRTRECTNPVPQFGGSHCSGNDIDTQTCNTNECPIDGGYTEWGEWGTCSLTCGSGQKSRTRECTNPIPQFGGSPCSGNDTNTQTCNTNECPIDGRYTEWGEWGTCSLTCGGGQRSRTRECTNPVPQFGGSQCSGNVTDTETCNTNECPIDGGYTEWGAWGTCSLTCGGGQQSRTRECTNPVPRFGGSPCSGSDIDSQICNTNECPIDGGYTEWGEWGTCLLTCGGGQQSRTRECTNPVPQFGGSPCSGNDTDTQTCNTNECPIDGGYTEWGEWGTCSLTCGGSQQSRTRECTNPVPQFGGSQCSGNDTETQTCNTNECPIEGGYTEWGEWGTCSLTCGGGQQSRTRECTNPVPQFGGSHCSGNDTDLQTCNTNECPIDGRYTEWGEWGTCSLTCGGGQQSRTRECTNPVPQFGGSQCPRNDTDSQTCNTNECPIDGEYTEWGEWGTCSLTCGGGQQSRTRECTNPVPQFGGSQCSGNDTDSQTCNTNECPIEGGYTEWGEWGTCSLTCGGGQKSRTRECTNPVPQFGGSLCSGNDTDKQTCNTNECPVDGGYTEWGEWDTCSLTCGSGQQSRTRECTNPVPKFGGSPCFGNDTETQTCNTNECPIDGRYTEWGEWGTCSLTCGGGQQSRTRECTNPVPQFGGSQCSGNNTAAQTCNINECPIDGGYTEWGEWDTSCSLTCGSGQKSRTRECTNPVPQFGGSPCFGNDTDLQTCNTNECPIDGGYTEWGEWGTCSLTCGGGQQSRTRECTNPVPQFGGSQCSGNDTAAQTCNINECPIDGGYTEWGEWDTSCSLTCGSGQKSRTRECTNPVPQFGGSPCFGNDTDLQTCNTNECPIDGGYTEWGAWGTCSLTCGDGQQSRTRECTNPVPEFRGSPCSGNDTDSQTCTTNECPIDGGYTEWGEWGTCSLICGGGQQSRTRECTNPVPQFGGSPCFGNDTDTETCNTNECPIDGGYTEWGEWGTCSLTCGGGQQSRTRECTNPVPQFGGSHCSGNDTDLQTCTTNECPIDGGYTEWGEWGTCSLICGSGQQSRTRECTNPVPQFGGSPCFGNDTDLQTCNTNECPIDGRYTEWGAWGTCSLTCGGGQQSRTRECTNPVPEFGGSPCSGNDTDSQTCTTNECPIDGGYTEWGEWGTCSLICGSGQQSRTRECTNPVPQFGGSPCFGNDTDLKTCNTNECPIDGGYTEWGAWGTCSLTCDSGQQSRTRECTNPVPQFGGSPCSGMDTDTQTCNTNECPIDGGNTEWGAWGTCSLTCDSGQQSRTRECTNPVPQFGGSPCSGIDTDTQTCNTNECPIDGGYTEWGDWGACSLTCGAGEQSRTRECTNPVPQYGGSPCSGSGTDTQTCNTNECPIDGGYTQWSVWSSCSVTCAGGERLRARECTDPVPQHGGNSCLGNDVERLICNEESCPVDGGFSEWATWSICTKTCGSGQETRSRDCNNPTPQYGGNDCIGVDTDVRECNINLCPDELGFSMWSDWTSCTESCDSGIKVRSRECLNPSSGCTGATIDTGICNTQPCPIDGGYTTWTEWSTCSVTCGGGEWSRTRECTNPAPEHGGLSCVGEASETLVCSMSPCQERVDGGFTEWSDWSECTVTCGGGEQTRTRACTNPEPQFGGSDCSGATEESQECNEENCLVDGGFTEWNSWSSCSVTCGDGEQTRTRDCTNPVPQLGGKDCEGNTEESQTCNLGHCAVNGGFTEWSSWGECAVTCGEGEQTRTRNCSNPAPLYGGDDCVGDSEETKTCDQLPCPVDGYLTDWEEWDTCSVSCGSGTRERNRTCVEPLHGGNPCVGMRHQTEFCNTQPCPLNGTWSEWAEWGNCSVTCGGGMRTRTRACIGPLHGGEECVGISQENETCNQDPCPIDGNWSEWNEWSTCTVSCNSGTRARTRTCTGQQYGGKACEGAATQTEFCSTQPCPVDGVWLGWSDWSTCTVTCGGGSQNRSRTCVEPIYDGEDCEGESAETETCNQDPCPVDGYWMGWSDWGSCSVSCADGVRNRSRTCVEPLHGGSECVGEISQSEACNNGQCPIDGYWSDWSEWTRCTMTCGGGMRNKTRTCNEPLYGGRVCEGELSEMDTCNIDACPIDGEWSYWSAWSMCTTTCGGGTREKNRSCSEPKYGGKFCDGERAETEMCNVDPCPVNGYWEEWSNWTECTVSCQGGSRDRFRTCVEAKFGGNPCVGISSETDECNTQECPVNSIWTEWSVWTMCTATCNGGIRGRARNCTKPLYGGINCQGSPIEVSDCGIVTCPVVDGVWTTWSDWSQCSATCSGGARNRSRTCILPLFDGKSCEGHAIDIQICGMEACPPGDGGWSTWTAWTACSMTCGFAERLRNRTCTNPSPEWGGKYCEGVHIQSDSCKENDCPVDGEWTEWTEWSPCYNMTVNNVTNPKCGHGVKQRNRSCDNPTPQFDGEDCSGNASEVTTCNVPCHRITCSKEHPEQCQIIFEYIPENKGSTVTMCYSAGIFILIFCIRLIL